MKRFREILAFAVVFVTLICVITNLATTDNVNGFDRLQAALILVTACAVAVRVWPGPFSEILAIMDFESKNGPDDRDVTGAQLRNTDHHWPPPAA